MLINWKLFNNKEVVIDDANKEASFDNGVITYIDDYGIHKIDQNKKVYEKSNSDGIVKIDFKNNLLVIECDQFKQEYDIKTFYEQIDNIIRLTYFIGDEEKIIEITKGDVL